MGARVDLPARHRVADKLRVGEEQKLIMSKCLETTRRAIAGGRDGDRRGLENLCQPY